MGHFGFFQSIKNYAETTLLIDKKIISQEASYAVQQSLRRVKSPKTSIREKNFHLIINKCDFYYIKPRISVLKYIILYITFVENFGEKMALY